LLGNFVMNFLTKWFGKSKSVVIEQYQQPAISCSSLILLSGPAYGDKTFFGSFLLNAFAVKSWAFDHSNSVWSSAKIEQQARVYIPKWLESASYHDDGYVTLIDLPMRQVLVPYTFDFYDKGWLSIYCHQCGELHDSLIDNMHNNQRNGSTSTWTDEWHCPNGHILHHKEQEVRWITRKPPKV
jgi:hypothetical protein